MSEQRFAQVVRFAIKFSASKFSVIKEATKLRDIVWAVHETQCIMSNMSAVSSYELTKLIQLLAIEN